MCLEEKEEGRERFEKKEIELRRGEKGKEEEKEKREGEKKKNTNKAHTTVQIPAKIPKSEV